jgi:hypothetical protein
MISHFVRDGLETDILSMMDFLWKFNSVILTGKISVISWHHATSVVFLAPVDHNKRIDHGSGRSGRVIRLEDAKVLAKEHNLCHIVTSVQTGAHRPSLCAVPESRELNADV